MNTPHDWVRGTPNIGPMDTWTCSRCDLSVRLYKGEVPTTRLESYEDGRCDVRVARLVTES